jgi:hypothetical protein
MKIIEALKKEKDLARKIDDLKGKIRQHCALSSLETPEYGKDQTKKVDGWVQSCRDLIKERLTLRVAIQKINMETSVSIEIGGKTVTKTIAEWIHRRRDLAGLEKSVYECLTDRGINEGLANGPGGTPMEIKIERFFNPESRDERLFELGEEPALIDAKLEVVNAVTDI